MKIEDDFFPMIAGELGTSAETAAQYQKKLDDFLPVVKVYSYFVCNKFIAAI